MLSWLCAPLSLTTPTTTSGSSTLCWWLDHLQLFHTPFWHKRLYLIDHGASLYFHHTGVNYLERSHSPFAQIKDHVLLPVATQLVEADALLKSRLNAPLLESIITAIPDEWLGEDSLFTSKEEHRAAYLAYLLERLAVSQIFVEEALHARASLV